MEHVELDELVEIVHKHRTDKERKDLCQFGFQFSTEFNHETRLFRHKITKVKASNEPNSLQVHDELVKINGFNACLLNDEELRSTICESVSKAHKDLIYLNLTVNRDHVNFSKETERFLGKEELESYWQKPAWKVVRIINRFLLGLFVLAIAAFIGVIVYLTPKCEPVVDIGWWQNAVCFKIDLDKLSSQCERNVNCSKPFQILKSKSVHFVEMKANCVWLSHMNNLSAGFDQINSSYGNIDEFKQLLSEYHRHNLKVLIDFIPNYTNDDHVWFRAMNETFRDFYVWTDTPNNWLNHRGESAWAELTSSYTKMYYLHQFEKNQPDLNYENPLVYQMFLDSIAYWLVEVGVDGINLVTVSRLFEDKLKITTDKRPIPNQRETFHLLAEIKSLMKNQNKLRKSDSEPILVVDSETELDLIDKQIVSKYYGNNQMSGVDLVLSHLSDEIGWSKQVELGLSNAFDNKKSPFWMPSDPLNSGLVSFLPGSIALDYNLNLNNDVDEYDKSLKEIFALRSSFRSVLQGRFDSISSHNGLMVFKRVLEPESNILVILNLNQTSHVILDQDSIKQLNIRNKKLHVELVFSNRHENRTKQENPNELVFDKNGYLSISKNTNGFQQFEICSMCGIVASWPYEAPDLNELIV